MDRRKFAFSEFIFDADTGTLLRKSRDLHLPEQTARLLEILLERANTLVTREELRQALWPDEEFLDYDQGINTAINRLRNALRDDSRNPQFIKTIPKRGYSFHGEVALVAEEVSSRADLSLTASPVIPALELSPPQPPSEAPAQLTPQAPAFVDLETPVHAPVEGITQSGTRLTWFALPLVAVILAAVGWVIHLRTSRETPHLLRLGVAPLQVQGSAQTNELGESFRLDLSDALSKLPGVQVRAASSFENTRRSALNIPLLSRELNLDDLLLGTIMEQGAAYDLKFELVRAEDAIHLASFEYSGTKQEMPSIRDRLQHDLFHYLQSRATTVQAINGSTNDAQAYELYLQGTYHMFDRSPGSLNQSVMEFQGAIARDPNFASAYAGVATAYLKLSAYDRSHKEGPLRKAQNFAQQAVKLDPLLAQAHAVLGYSAFTQDWNFTQGETELQYAIRIDPNQADYRDWLCILLTDEGRFDEGLKQIALAHADDPRWPSVYAMESLMASYARQNSTAIAAGKTYLEMLPSLPLAHNTMGWTYFQAGQYKDAIAEWRRMALLQNDEIRVKLEEKGLEVLKTKGIRAYAQLHLDAIRSNSGVRQKNDFIAAEWYTCAGKHDEALAELERMASLHDPYVLAIAVNPVYDAFHHDSRFLMLLSKIGLTLPASLNNVNAHLCEARPGQGAS
jgi:DNA-binding winged helix-turn-helix (wHTH) protein/Tfp pilus assembly protein PilF/TolB-like protein